MFTTNATLDEKTSDQPSVIKPQSNFQKLPDGSVLFTANDRCPANPLYVLKRYQDGQVVETIPLPGEDFWPERIELSNDAKSAFLWRFDYGRKGNVPVVLMDLEQKRSLGSFVVVGEVICIQSIPNSDCFMISYENGIAELWKKNRKHNDDNQYSFDCVARLRRLNGSSYQQSVALTADGQYCFQCVGGVVRIIQISDNQSLADVKTINFACSSMLLAPDNNHLLLGMKNGCVQVWDVRDKNNLMLVAEHSMFADKAISALQLAQSKSHVLVGVDNQFAMVPLSELLAQNPIKNSEVENSPRWKYCPVELPDFSFLTANGSELLFPGYKGIYDQQVKAALLNVTPVQQDVANPTVSYLKMTPIIFFGKGKNVPTDGKDGSRDHNSTAVVPVRDAKLG